MAMNRRKYDEAFKKRAVRLSYTRDRAVEAVAQGLGITSSMLYRRRKKYTAQGEQTAESMQEDVVRKLQARIAELEKRTTS